MQKQYTTVKDLVYSDLSERSIEQVKGMSQNSIDNYFWTLQTKKAHLCATPLKLATVNRYVEMYLKKQLTK